VITPDTLRFLGKTVERLRSEIRDVTRSANTIQSRITLQDRELSRQLSLLSDMERAIDRLNKSGGEGGRLRLKLDTVMGQHQKLDERLNRCLQVLMDNYEPKLSEPEKQWFGELKRMKVDIDGDDGRSLHDRTQKVRLLIILLLFTSHTYPNPSQLKHQLEVLRPGLQELAEKEADRRKRTQGRGSALGTAQLHTVQSRLTQE
jgi:nucleoporin NUP82